MGVAVGKETPASHFEQLVDLDSGCGFLICHSVSQYHHGCSSVITSELRGAVVFYRAPLERLVRQRFTDFSLGL